MRPSARRHAVRQTVSRPFVGRVAMINSYDTVPDDLVYRRRVMTRACSVPPSPVLSAARYDYIPLSTSRIPLEVLGAIAPCCLSRCWSLLHVPLVACMHAPLYWLLPVSFLACDSMVPSVSSSALPKHNHTKVLAERSHITQ